MRRALPFALAVLLAPGLARASGFDAPQIGSAQSGPVANDAAAVWWNPGRLAYLKRSELLVGAGLIMGSIGYQRELRGQYQYADNLDFKTPVAPGDIDPSKTGRQRKLEDTPLGPGFDVFFAIPVLRDRLVVGGGISIPYVATLGFPASGPQRFAGRSLFLAAPHATVSIAARLHDVISIGAGISYVLGNMSLSKVQDFAALDTFGQSLARPPIGQANDFGAAAPPQVRELDVLARPVELTKMFAHGVSFNAGIALQPTKKLAIGLVYHHGANLKFNGHFRLNMDDDFFTQDLAAQGLQYAPIVSGKAQIRIRLPKRVTLGLGYQITKRFALDGFVTYATYQDFDKVRIRFISDGLAQPVLGVGNTVDQDVVRNWKGTVLTELNARIDATEKLRVSVMTGYHGPASPDSTIDIISPDGHRLVFGAGIVYRFSERAAILADFEGQVIVPRHVTASDYDLGNGTYNLFLSATTIHGQFRFGVPGDRRRARDRERAGTPAKPDATEPPGPVPKVEPTPAAGGTEPAPPPAPPGPTPVPPPPPPPP